MPVVLSAAVAAVFGFAITFLMPEIDEARVTLRPVATENDSGFARLAESIGGDLTAEVCRAPEF